MTLRDDVRRMVRENIRVDTMKVLELSDDETRVTLDDGTGNPINDVPCATSYADRDAGDLVQVLKLGNSWTVLCAIGKSAPAVVTTQDVADMIVDAMPTIPPAVTVTMGNSGPSGSGWQQAAVLPFVRDDGNGARAIHFQLAAAQSPSAAPATVKPVRPKTVGPNSHGSWRTNGQTDGGIKQGPSQLWTGNGSRWTGAMFYGNNIKAAVDAGGGPARVDYMEVAVARDSRTGWNRRIPIRMGTHGRQTRGKVTDLDHIFTLARLAWGGRVKARLSAGVTNALATGDGWGLGITTSDPGDYLALTEGSGTVTITFKN